MSLHLSSNRLSRAYLPALLTYPMTANSWPARALIRARIVCLVVSACASPPGPPGGQVGTTDAPEIVTADATGVRYRGTPAPHSQAADAAMLTIPAGSFIIGSNAAEREQAYRDYQRTAGHDAARRGRWFDREYERRRHSLGTFRIDATLVSNDAYAEFVRDTGAARPYISAADWDRQGFIQHYDPDVVRYFWTEPTPPETAPTPPPGRHHHPVVLVTWSEAARYCIWRGQISAEPRRLPSEAEYEKAARGRDGRAYPWGNEFDPKRLNSQVAGPYDTTPVSAYANGTSPYGMYDAAGNVFQWTRDRWRQSSDRMTVKGSAWDDYAGVGRGAQRHGRRAWARHVLIGFRCAADGPAD